MDGISRNCRFQISQTLALPRKKTRQFHICPIRRLLKFFNSAIPIAASHPHNTHSIARFGQIGGNIECPSHPHLAFCQCPTLKRDQCLRSQRIRIQRIFIQHKINHIARHPHRKRIRLGQTLAKRPVNALHKRFFKTYRPQHRHPNLAIAQSHNRRNISLCKKRHLLEIMPIHKNSAFPRIDLRVFLHSL